MRALLADEWRPESSPTSCRMTRLRAGVSSVSGGANDSRIDCSTDLIATRSLHDASRPELLRKDAIGSHGELFP